MDAAVMASAKTAKIEVRAEPEWVAWVHRGAKKKGLSASSLARMVITEWLERNEIPPEPVKPSKR